MKEIISGFIEKLFNPTPQSRQKADIKRDLQAKFSKSLYLKEYIKSKAWVEIDKPMIHKQVESGLSQLIRDGMELNEIQLKTIIASIRANVNRLSEMRFIIEEGEKAGIKLERLS